MSAGISYMYRTSGGCTVMKRCHGCRWIKEDEERSGFGRRTGKTVERYECLKHPDDTGRKNWNKNYTACKYYEEPNVKTVYAEGTDGQLSFF